MRTSLPPRLLTAALLTALLTLAACSGDDGDDDPRTDLPDAPPADPVDPDPADDPGGDPDGEDGGEAEEGVEDVAGDGDRDEPVEVGVDVGPYDDTVGEAVEQLRRRGAVELDIEVHRDPDTPSPETVRAVAHVDFDDNTAAWRAQPLGDADAAHDGVIHHGDLLERHDGVWYDRGSAAGTAASFIAPLTPALDVVTPLDLLDRVAADVGDFERRDPVDDDPDDAACYLAVLDTDRLVALHQRIADHYDADVDADALATLLAGHDVVVDVCVDDDGAPQRFDVAHRTADGTRALVTVDVDDAGDRVDVGSLVDDDPRD